LLIQVYIYIYIYIFRKALASPGAEVHARKLPAGVIEGRESERGERRSRATRRTDSVPVHFELIL